MIVSERPSHVCAWAAFTVSEHFSSTGRAVSRRSSCKTSFSAWQDGARQKLTTEMQTVSTCKK
eukprot:2754853-Rhodomonas_salina.1